MVQIIKEFILRYPLVVIAGIGALLIIFLKVFRNRYYSKRRIPVEATVVRFQSGYDGRSAPVFSFVYQGKAMELPAQIKTDYRTYQEGEIHTVFYFHGEEYVEVPRGDEKIKS